MPEQAYSVRIPQGFPRAGSNDARRMLSRLFREKTSLAPDPGSGDVVLRLTLPEAQVLALRAIADGDSASVALRRLLVTYSRALPAPKPVELLPARSESSSSMFPPEQAEDFESVPTRAIGCPGWFDPKNPNRLSYWQSLGIDWQLRMLERRPLVPVAKSSPSRPQVAPKPDRARSWLALAAWIGLAALLLWLFQHFATRGAAGAGGTAPGPRFPEWRPQ